MKNRMQELAGIKNNKVIMILSSPNINPQRAKQALEKQGYEVVDFGVETSNYDYESDKAMAWLDRKGASKFEFVNK